MMPYNSMISQFSKSKKLEYIKDDNFRLMQEYYKYKNFNSKFVLRL